MARTLSVGARERERVASKIRSAKPEQKIKANDWQKNWRANNPLRWLFQVARARAKKLGLPFDNDMSDLYIPERCPILGIPLVKGQNQAGPHSPSLDRIVPHLGYVKGNRWFISNRANTMKNDATLEELVLLGEWAKKEISNRADILKDI